jgi:NADH:ubiquinone oxidoreductase subunit K
VSLLNAPTLAHYLVLGAILFAISMAGIFLNRKNVIILLMAIELMLLAVNLNFIAFSRYPRRHGGQVFVFFILTVARPSPRSASRSWCCCSATRVDRRRGSGETQG